MESSGKLPPGGAAELLDGTLKLRCCTTPFSKRYPPWILLRYGGRLDGQGIFTATHSCDGSKSGVARVRLTRKSHPGNGAQVAGHDGPDPELPTPRRWEKIAASPSSEGEV